MNESKRPAGSIWRNWLSLAGLAIGVASIFSFILLLVLDVLAPTSNPYVGILLYMVAPAFFFIGIGLFVLGIWLKRRRLEKIGAAGGVSKMAVSINFSRPRDRKILIFFILSTVVFLLIASVGSYQSYHFAESTEFCGKTCHTVMEPEFVTYSHSSHARVSCVECHIGEGATWFVKSKISGSYQVYATLADKYPRPIPTPIKNLRPAQETCERCHWPQKFSGNLERTYDSYLTDDTNTQYSVRMLLKVGGGDPEHGPVGGIHWHMNIANKVEYIATDRQRQKIPWVRVTDKQGVVTEYKTADFTNDIASSEIRVMDCMDCHNRPAHRYQSANTAVNKALSIGTLNKNLPLIKSNAVALLVATNYTTKDDALKKIATALDAAYPRQADLRSTIDTVQALYSKNFFPEMKADWRGYPENIGHKDWPGCFRCHDGNHKSSDGRKMIESKDCNTCHLILAQGSGEDLNRLSPKGEIFKHPGEEEYDPAYKCNDCHNGGL